MAKSNKKNQRSAKAINANSEELKAFVRTISKKYLQDPNINSVGIGLKSKDGKLTSEVAIQFTVDRKLSIPELEGISDLPGRFVIPEELEFKGTRLKTDVIERSYSPCFIHIKEAITDDRKTRREPLVPGISVGNIKVTAGTIGAIVYDNKLGEPLILSNWHVLNGPNGKIGDDIVQPGTFDDNNTAGNVIGKLKRSFLGLAGDCAICSLSNRKFNTAAFELNITPSSIANPELGDKVIKSGRTTGVTHGIVRRIEVTAKLNYGGSVGIKEIGGFEIGVDSSNAPSDGEISMGGDSGSIWLVKDKNGKPTTTALGLHFAGEASGDQDEHALACNLDAVCKKLEISFKKPNVENLLERRDGLGYSENFLDIKVRLPKVRTESRGKVLDVGNANNTLDYTHFSIVMNEDRRLCYFSAVNIDGTNLRNIVRKGDKWFFDTRIDEKFQTGNELYASNNIDRGHMTRRLDAVWGSAEEARIANEDTFYYTNACPQHADLNQGEWNELEEYILGNAGVHELKVSVFTGPVFREQDRIYRDVQIPEEFWKVVAFVREDTGHLSATAYLLSQKDKLDDLEDVFVFGEFKTFQVPVSLVERLTGLSFGTLRKWDPLNTLTESAGLMPLTSVKEIVV